ncbi:MAG: hypothetical protein AAF899_04680 [Pseudomonadota bacterium]
MNIATGAEALIETAEKTDAPKARSKDAAWIENGHVEAKAHNGRPGLKGTELFKTDIHVSVGEASAEVKRDLHSMPGQVVLGGAYIAIWGFLGLVIVGLFLEL